MQSTFLSDGAQRVRIRAVTLDHPWRWLSAGWLDMCSEPGISYVYGAVFTACGVLLLFGLDQWGVGYLILPLAFGFALVGPAAAVGLYEISRRLDTGAEVSFGHALGAFRRNPAQIGLVGMFLIIAFIAWVRLAMLEFMLFFGSAPPSLDHLLDALFLSSVSVPFLAVGLASGAVLAAGVFAMTAIAIPMLVDRPECDAMTAMLTSLDAVRRNPRPMILWAGLIAFFTLLGGRPVLRRAGGNPAADRPCLLACLP
ncbi:MAG: DUF2189 domain-containing protein [Magnetospirillum sp.]|nr:DUF2189 domain-containing protein [Magnetospirillum sp.]